jgi:hypothetical protein
LDFCQRHGRVVRRRSCQLVWNVYRLCGLGDFSSYHLSKGGEHSTLIDINGDGRPDRVFDRNPKNNQQGIYVHLNTGSGFSSGWRWQNDY